MAKEKIRMEDKRLIVDLSVIHKPFGWLVFLTGGVLGILFNPNFFDLVFGLAGFWSVRRKCQICWLPEYGVWSYRKRNFFKWSETRYDMSYKDVLALQYYSTWKTGEGHSSSYHLYFIPSVELKKPPFFYTGKFFLQIFGTPLKVANASESINKIKGMYSLAGKALVVDLSEMQERSKLLLEEELERI